MPRCAGIDGFFGEQSFQRRGGERLALAIDLDQSVVSSALSVTKSLGRMRRQKAFEAERFDRRLDHIVEDQARHGVRRHRRQQDAVAMMAGGIEQAFQRPAPEDRRIVAAAGPVTDPHFVDRQFLDRRHRAPGGLEQRRARRRR